MEELLNQVLFNINGTAITFSMVIVVCGIGIITVLFYLFGVKRILNFYEKNEKWTTNEGRHLKYIIGSCLFLVLIIIAVNVFNLNQDLYPNRYFLLSWTSILRGLLIAQFARLVNFFFLKVISNYYNQQVLEGKEPKRLLEEITKQDSNRLANSSFRIAIFLFAFFLLFQNFRFDPELITLYSESENPFVLKLSTLLTILLVITLGRVFIWAFTQLILLSYYQKNKINVGTQYAINQLISYFVYVIAILSILHFLDIKMTVVWGGLAALLVGVGLGLQQTFNDLFSGLVLLFERGIEVGEVIEIDGTIGSLKKIGLRTSVIESRDNITIIVPNSKLVVNNVINWSHYDDKVRFKISIGVAYGSDTRRVKKILLETANEHSFILKYPLPSVRFTNFGNSSLDFELLFFSKNFRVIEDIKSDVRFEVDRRFRENNIEIPFPQRDIWIRKNEKIDKC